MVAYTATTARRRANPVTAPSGVGAGHGTPPTGSPRCGLGSGLAANGPDALRLIEQHAPEIGLVLLGWNLTGTSGKETIAGLLERRPDLRVMRVTGAREATVDEQATRDTVLILLQPFSHHERVLAVTTLLGA